MTWRTRSLVVWGCAVAIGAWAATARLRVENPGGQWHPLPLPPEEQLWRFAQAQFGSREMLLVAVRLPRPVRGLALVGTDSLERWVARQTEVDRVFGPADARRLQGGALTRLLSREKDSFDELRHVVLSRDGSVALIYVTLKPQPPAAALGSRVALLSRLGGEGPRHLPPGAILHFAGKPALDVGLNALLARDALVSAPLAMVVMFLALGLLLGRRCAAPIVAVAAALVLLLGALAAAAVPISTATVVALPVTVVLGLSYGIHTEAALAHVTDRRLVWANLARPLGWAYATTVVALLSFLLSPVAALRSFAWSTAGGVSLAFLSAIGLVPALTLRHATGGAARILAAGTFRLFAATVRRPRLVTWSWLLAGIGTSIALTHVRLEPNNYLAFFPPHHPVVVAHQELDRAFGGSVPVEIVAESDSGEAWRDPRVRDRLASFARESRALQVGPVLLPVEPRLLSRHPDLAEAARSWFRAADSHYTRALLAVPVESTRKVRALLGALDSLAAAHSDHAVLLRVTGVLPASLPLLQALVETQLRSLTGLLVVVAVALLLAAPTARSGLLLLTPNIVPLLAVGAAMAALAISLDFTTVLVFSMLLGVAVDDTLHISWAARGAARHPLKGVAAAMRREAAPVTLTSFTAVLGFASLLLSPYPAARRLGGLMALGLAVAWLADVTLTPVILAAARVRTHPRTDLRTAAPAAGPLPTPRA